MPALVNLRMPNAVTVSAATTVRADPADITAVLAAYRSSQSHCYDEFLGPDGKPRPHWHAWLSAIGNIPALDRASRATRLDRRVRETGIAYDIYADPSKPSQRWHLDLTPVIFSASEWHWLERALTQRARLFDAILNDVYGPQRLMRSGHVPPELVFSDSTYLRPCQHILPAAGQLQFYAADLARGLDGQWRVIDNHTETLAGLGFALANRVVHSHIAGDIFKQCNAVRLANYFQEMQSALTAHSGRKNARTALLTPGPHHADYFSHAYLARYLGYLLVEGSDLVTKGSQIYLKTLEGLKNIDLLIRCVDGRSVDPLELDPGGFEGPAGLIRVCRDSPRLVVNAPGTGLVQNRGFGACLQNLASELLGENLLLPDAPRWWLGDPQKRAHVLANLEHFVIRKAQEGTGRPGQAALGQDPQALTSSERQLLEREIALHGHRLVAEEKIGFSAAPVLSANGPDHAGLAPRPFAVRMFVTRTASGYIAMPGGLAMSVDPDRAVALSAPDGHTRDVWIVSDAEQAPHISLWRPTVENARVERSQRVIQSRVADDLFWLGRYTERADWTMRVMRSALRRVTEDSGPASGRRGARKCLELMLGIDAKHPASTAKPADREIEVLCTQLIGASKAPRTLERSCNGLYRVANLARDRLSLEAWHTLSKLRPGDPWSASLAKASPGTILDNLDEGLAALAAFNGLMHENMTRNYGWSFLDMGRRLERATNLSEAIDGLFVPRPGEDEEASSLMLLLEIADSYITYRSRYRLDPLFPLVLDLLLLDETNPRSLAFQIAAFSRHMEGLPHRGLADDRRILLTLLTSIRLANVEGMAGEPGSDALAKLMEEQLQLLPELSNAVARHYFSLLDDTPHRVQTRSQPRP